MANQIYNSIYGTTGLSSVYSSRLTGASVTDPYLSDASLIGSSRYLSSDPLAMSDPSKFSVVDRGSLYLNSNDPLRFSGSDMAGIGGTGGFSTSRISGGYGVAAGSTPSMLTQTSWPGVDVLPGAAVDAMVSGAKRPSEALYHQTVLGTHNSTIGQSEALFSANSLAKRPRFETASNLPMYPQRPGEKDCPHYMLKRTCRFGDSCKYDHPLWVPEGGIPDWKEVPLVALSESLPERPGEPDCPYYLKTLKCKFGFRCKFNHPKDNAEGAEIADISVLPDRPSEPICTFHHPKDLQIPLPGQDPASGGQTESAMKDDGTATADANPVKTFVPFTPALLHNSKGLPIRPGEVDCPFYLKTGSCKYGVTCRYNHPDRNAINPPVAGSLGHPIITPPATNMPIGAINPATASFLPNLDPRLAQTTLGLGPTIYPQRPGQLECDFYMKTGACKFGERCKYHHPIDRSAPTPSITIPALQQNVKLTLAGLPRREGAVNCPFYMKTGSCKYGPSCRFDHPPPGEVIAMATTTTAQGNSGVGENKEIKTELVEEQGQ
eukprot:TRINITY_DN5608_c0_g1_i2.p1 TRINITY_DN5608_c0_g1~~TRINITY_DN5608_c0_g1_i2.p1  ORF type:complete len:549 (+),score=71.11 TRINITY_DN5608_c0_g1_i2:93-1739(+)